MCGLFTITPRSTPKSPKTERKQEKSGLPPPKRRSRTYARVDAIMGTRLSYRSQDSANIKEEDEKQDIDPSSSTTKCSSSISLNESKYSAQQPSASSNGALHPITLRHPVHKARSMDSIIGSPPRPRARPGLYERKKYPSSPLANIGTQQFCAKNMESKR